MMSKAITDLAVEVTGPSKVKVCYPLVFAPFSGVLLLEY